MRNTSCLELPLLFSFYLTECKLTTPEVNVIKEAVNAQNANGKRFRFVMKSQNLRLKNLNFQNIKNMYSSGTVSNQIQFLPALAFQLDYFAFDKALIVILYYFV